MSIALSKLIVTALGTGYAPKAPGTAGSIFAGFLLYAFNYLLLKSLGDGSLIILLNSVLIIFTFFIGGYAIKKVHSVWEHDSGKIVIDEVIGVFITLVAAPLDWRYYVLGVVLFRVFDIWKPLYIRRFDNMQSDWSVMWDDVLAGIYSFIVLELIIYLDMLG